MGNVDDGRTSTTQPSGASAYLGLGVVVSALGFALIVRSKKRGQRSKTTSPVSSNGGIGSAPNTTTIKCLRPQGE
jgi:hypothetical protein